MTLICITFYYYLGHLYFSGMSLGVAPRTEGMCWKNIGLHAQNMITNLGSTITRH